MKIAFLTIADAANDGPDGKLNFLGAGIRILRPSAANALISLVIVGQVDADDTEAGTYPVQLFMTGPDGVEVMRLEFDGVVGASDDPEVPTGFGFVINLARPFTLSGLYRLVARVADLIPAEYIFKVMPLPAPADDAQVPGEPVPA